MSPASIFHRIAAQKRRLGIGLGILAAAIALFGLLGYFWLPGYAKTKLESTLSEALQRPVTVQSVEIQPFTLELTVRGFRVGEKTSDTDAGEALLSIDELYTNLSIASVSRRAPVISSVSVRGPAVRLVREGENRFNITDLVEDFMKRPAGGKTMFAVSNILVEDGRFIFIDRVKKSQQEISGIRLGVPFIANFESDEQSWVEPHFSAKVNGAPLTLEGKLRPFTRNREATLELKLNDVDLTRVDEYSPIPVGISLHSGYLDSNLLLTFTQVDGEAPKMVLTGVAALRKLRIENHAVEMPYTAKLDKLDVSSIEVNLNGSKPSHVRLGMAEAAIAREGDTQPVLSLPSLSVSQVAIDLTRKTVVLGDVILDRMNASVRRESDGRLDLVKLFSQVPNPKQAPETAPAKTQATKPWAVRLGSFKLTGAALRFEDVSLANVAPMVIQPLDLTVDHIDFSGASPLKLTLNAAVNQHGSLETSGTLAWAPLAAAFDVDAKDIDLVSLQGWAGDRMNALITRGAASFRGKVKAEGSPIKIVLNGDSKFSNFSVLDKLATTDLLRWRSLDLSGIEFVNEPLRVNINSVAIADFFAYVILSPQGELNLKHIIRQEADKASPGKPASAPQETVKTVERAPSGPRQTAISTPSPPDRQPVPVRIGRILLQGGNVNFHDQFIKPNYRANLTGLGGRIGPLDPEKPGEIDVHGTVDKTAPLKISGKVNTFGKELYLDLTATAKGIDMPAFSPYSGKYVGYAIEKGKLSVDIHYHIEKGELTAENNVFLDQLTFGEKIESPDALAIPVTLAVALLKNRRGEIDVHLPISGSINDPEFSIGAVIVKVIVNLLTKAVTAPFSLLGSLFAGGEELSEISFSPGHAEVTPEAEKRLQALSKALTDRPALKLEIMGEADPMHDPDALKRAILERKVKAQKLLENVKKGETSGLLDDIELTPEEHAKYLALAYKEEKFAKPKNVIGLTKSLPAPEMEQLLLANINAGDSEMRELAEVRAENARDWLIEKGGIPGDRIFMLEPKVQAEADSKKSASRVEFSLR
ncbi:DUF748 domain-containing protein [Nitrosovibrio tenuis]|uniref:Uncharacterized protein involved in outer membrane biogenesis n=1 Tax=Nitrosovibrio tenuis TaxID=1233 RepID=A0A1H7LCL4_9PROT|nr:DUF748 domain-containing protein [Nitrosovibrio tenuis]SEK96684.1 Uncharacterized protein involved in outer membrane biogenesis [Nitrosovibrio tenuis]